MVGHRNQAPGFNPRRGEGARRFGGRYNPPHTFAVIYLCATRACAVAELTRQAHRQAMALDDFLPRELWQVTAELSITLDLTDRATRDALNVEADDLVRADVQLTREIGQASHDYGFQAIQSPSATGIDRVIAVFPDNLAGTALDAELIEQWRTAADLQ